MNWKRGLTRIYLVLWAVLAAVGMVAAVSASRNAAQDQKRVEAFLKAHRGQLTLAALQHLPLDSLRDRVADRLVAYGGATHSFPRSATAKEIREFFGASEAEPLHVVRTYDYEKAQAAGYDDDEIAGELAAELDSAGSVRVSPRVAPGLLLALQKRGLSVEQIAKIESGGVTTTKLEAMQVAATSDAVAHPVFTLAGFWGLWTGVCLALPAILLWVLNWIVTGFSVQQEMRRHPTP